MNIRPAELGNNKGSVSEDQQQLTRLTTVTVQLWQYFETASPLIPPG
jgi:hypothetical protein